LFSIITTIITNNFNFKIFNKKLIFHNFVIFFIIYCFSKILFWTNFKDFVFYEITSNSRHYEYGTYLELVILLIIILAFIFLSLIIQHSKTKTKNSLVLINVLIIFSLIFFFIESFNTHGFFIDDLGHSKVHWQTYIGPVELMLQGGYLLWDVPSQYGFLSTILIYIMPFDDPWMKLYYLNSLLTFSFSIILFLTIWNKGSFLWLLIAFLITYSVIFLLPGGQWQYNVSSTPSSGMMRFIVSIILIFFVVKIHNRSLLYQILIITPIWLIGVMWSFESAFYCSCIIFPWIINNLFFVKNSTRQKIIALLIFPVSFIILVVLISFYYLLQLGHLPDYWAFLEYAFAWTTGHANILINTSSTFVAWLLLISMFLSLYSYSDKKFIFITSLILLYSFITYFITRGADIVIINQLKLYFFILFLNLNLMKNSIYLNAIKKFSPIFVLTIIFSFCNPSIINHLFNTASSQDYKLSKVKMENTSNFNNILKLIGPNNKPIAYIEEGRYLNTYFSNSIKNDIWIPVHPASLFQPLNPDRIEKYIYRWLQRRNINEGWLIFEQNSHWNERIIKIVRSTLVNYKIKEIINYKNIKAILLQKDA